ncbi:MAG: Aminopeptidase [Chitinophagaceae bacterium]|nr:Aminopeptidase [Chitinophagaceae bacterium]
MRKLLLLPLMITMQLVIMAQVEKQGDSKYNPRELFPASSMLPSGNTYRSATGEPGPAYWQNRADYNIDASLDDKQHIIIGNVTITYTNNSPEALSDLWLQVEQNAYTPHSRGMDAKLLTDSNQLKLNKSFEGGYTFRSVQVISQSGKEIIVRKAAYTVTDTRMQIRLATPLLKGRKVKLKIAYSYTIPRFFYNNDFNVNRTDILPSKNGDIYSIAQWYPRLCVLDDVEGWNTLPFLGNGEFYLEYGDFRVNLTLPSAYIVEASGELLNPQEVLTPKTLQRWKAAHNSEQKFFIRTSEEVTDTASRPTKAHCTWKFALNNARDFAWTASKSFVWEAIRINLPSGKKVFGVSVYPVESKLPGSWDRSSEYIKFTIEYFSKQWYEYPYPCAVNVASNLEGMEYPGIVFCSSKDTGNNYWKVVNHELGHTWFPMIVGNNERKYAWMDEGFNVFMDNIASEDFNKGEFAGYFADHRSPPTYFADSVPPVMTRPDGITGDMVFHTQYLKINYLLRLLRDHILGKEIFERAFRKYLHQWAYKHPTPWDFFHSINNSTGEDLGWFWKAMFIESYQLDQAVSGVRYINDNPGHGAEISIENLEKAAMPLIVEVTTVSGKKEKHRFPVEIWSYNGNYTFRTTTTEAIRTVVIDPDKIYPDINRDNNKWK